MSAPPDSPEASWRDDSTFMTALMALLFVGLLTFAGLWLMEKGKSSRLGTNLDDARQQIVRQQMLLQRKTTAPPVLPAGLPAELAP